MNNLHPYTLLHPKSAPMWLVALLVGMLPWYATMAQNHLRVSEIGGFPQSEAGYAMGVSACFAGTIGNHIIMAGGCNFPDNSGVKHYYKGIYAACWQADTLQWRCIGTLPEPVAYGATVDMGDSLLLIGGNNQEHILRQVVSVKLDPRGNAIVMRLPSLPVTVDNGAAAYAKGHVFVFGGNQNGKPSKALWSLSCSRPTSQWKSRKAMPGKPRVQPVCVAHGQRLFAWGGFYAKGAKSKVATDGYAYDVKRNRWAQLAAPRDAAGESLTLSGATGATNGAGLLLCLGGVNKTIFADAISGKYQLVDQADYLKQPVAWYRFNATPLVFNAKTLRWLKPTTPDARLARAGALLVGIAANQFFYIGGELKPGVRTPQILRIELE